MPAPRQWRGGSVTGLQQPLLLLLAFISCLSFYRMGMQEGLHSRTTRGAGEPHSAAVAAALRGSGAALHGPVEKTGHLDVKTWHPLHMRGLNRNFSIWIDRQQRDAIGMLPPFVFPGCALWVNHDYRFIFVRHPKCATTSLLKHFTLCIEPTATKSCLEMWSGTQGTVGNTSVAAIQQMWQDYFVFTIVRNPLSRAISSYKFVLSATLAKPECINLMNWDMFCADPVVAGQICRWKPKCCPFGDLFAFAHIPDQSRCMLASNGGLAVDYVARMEHLQEDLAYVFSEINRRRADGLPPIRYPAAMAQENTAKPCDKNQKLPPQHGRMFPSPFFGVVYNFSTQVARESGYCTMQQFYHGRHAHCLPSISRAYEQDISLLYPVDQLY